MDSFAISDFRFRRSEHLRKPSEISGLFSNGGKYSLLGGKLFIKRNTLEFSRIAFPLIKKYGNAVSRNRSRRLSREVYRKNKDIIAKGYDFAVLIYPGHDSYKIRKNLIMSLFNKAGLVKTVTV